MGKISQRSVNIREAERAMGNIETAQGHLVLIMTSFTDAIKNIEDANLNSSPENQTQIPELYYKISGGLLLINETLEDCRQKILLVSEAM
jgi:hypothetical protein